MRLKIKDDVKILWNQRQFETRQTKNIYINDILFTAIHYATSKASCKAKKKCIQVFLSDQQ